MQAPAVRDRFSINLALSTGWRVFRENFLLLLAIFLVAAAVVSIPGLIAKLGAERIASGTTLTAIQFTCGVAHFVLQWLMQAGMIKVSLDFVRYKTGAFADLFSCGPIIVNYFIGSLLYSAMVLVGLILFIIPGIIWLVQFQFFNYAIVDEGLGPIAALKRSAELTRGCRWSLLGFALLVALINVLGFLCLIVGLLVTSIVTFIASASVYEQLKAHAANGADATTEVATA